MNDTTHRQAARGEDAARILDSEAYRTAMQCLREQIHVQWKACKIKDTEGQQLLLQFARLADDFESVLSGMVEGGKLAQHQIDLDKHRNESGARRMLRKVL